jgi:hypothetical protein
VNSGKGRRPFRTIRAEFLTDGRTGGVRCCSLGKESTRFSQNHPLNPRCPKAGKPPDHEGERPRAGKAKTRENLKQVLCSIFAFYALYMNLCIFLRNDFHFHFLLHFNAAAL